MNRPTQWFDHFFAGTYGRVLGGLFDPAKSHQQASVVKRLARIRKGQQVLDIPCGQGRLTIPLAAMGVHMTGVDRTKSYVRQARRAAREQDVSARFICGDMRNVEFEQQFDAAFNWFGSFGYFSDDENVAFARKIRAALKPGGRLLVEGLNQSWLTRSFLPRSETTVNGVRIQNSRRWNAKTQRIRDRWTLTYRGKSEQHTIHMRIYDARGIRSLLRRAGFGEIDLFAYPRVGRLTRYSPRWIAVARRPRN